MNYGHLENPKDYLLNASSQGFALGAFNLDNLETLKAVTAAAAKTNSPVIVEVSPGELDYLEMSNLASLVDNAKREFGVPLFLNLDHATDLNIIEKSLDFGFSLVHFDGSRFPLEENTEKTKQVVFMAHQKDVLVEGEVDPIGGPLTDPEVAKKFVADTGVDIFAVSIGNNHGISEHEGINLDLLRQIHGVLPETFLSLHGGSGIPDDQIRTAIKLGVVKININSELRIAFKKNLDLTVPELAWYKITPPAIEAISKVVENKTRIFGSEGKV